MKEMMEKFEKKIESYEFGLKSLYLMWSSEYRDEAWSDIKQLSYDKCKKDLV